MQLVLNTRLQTINSTSARKWCHVELRYNGTPSKTKSKTNFTKQVRQCFIWCSHKIIYLSFQRFPPSLFSCVGGWCCSYLRFNHLVYTRSLLYNVFVFISLLFKCSVALYCAFFVVTPYSLTLCQCSCYDQLFLLHDLY